jgi:hypothetical protein
MELWLISVRSLKRELQRVTEERDGRIKAAT